MCRLCDEGNPQDHTGSEGSSRRDFLKVSAASGAAVAALDLFGARPDAAQADGAPQDSGPAGTALRHSRRPRHVDGPERR